MADKLPALTVPSIIISPADVTRLRREVKAIDAYLAQEALRQPGQPQARLPRLSHVLDELTTVNTLNLLDKTTRDRLLAFLDQVATSAPVVHISFASDPSAAFLQKLVVWFRKNIHPSTLVRVGLQPTIAAGCVVRTTNKYFDLSLRQTLRRHQPELLAAIKASGRPAA